jgi:hypothetical protein
MKKNIMILTDKQLRKTDETLKDFKTLMIRYREVKGDDEKLKSFLTRNRNPLWDLTNCKYFKTGLMSEESRKKPNKNLVDDHYIQRSKGLRFVFEELDKNVDMNLETFIEVVKKYSSTVKLTKDEHKVVTSFNKKNPSYLNYETYLACNIKVEGLSDIILK